MPDAVLVDSSFYIGLLREGRDPAVELLKRTEVLDLATCGVVQMEVLRGVISSKARASLTRFLSVMIQVQTDNALWESATKLAWDLDRDGATLPATDLVIASCALRIDAAVLTFDKHFDSVPGLGVFHSLDELY
jgi:predicted nucleic acid-binding protein